jgi:hypothetical protein
LRSWSRGSRLLGLCVRAARSSCIASAAIVGGIVGGSTASRTVAGERGSPPGVPLKIFDVALYLLN